ncbi:glycosyltransferase involved in cell wall biosynthesis [Mucilaginibacter yixingensis]|uniref:Glycosyltransferase involved in cell wall biosynthesis n=1 Tax=Mucilaginibacter yixingensis TaxID=1295612 RepID=A0A2T5JFR1_9SPHI|nr:glycosyltransferase family 4 protein [Mucilaginibacter yixingensis]PTR01267.1 glycosyltransferase involved in cell wall biosynthesis [Mucilaginibacter yixingensis]
MRKLAIVVTHPIQYYAPVFELLTQRRQIAIKVFYTWGDQSNNKHDPGFGKKITWDLPLLTGYDYEWARNTSAQPGSHHFKGIITPDLIAQIENYQPDAILVFGWAYQSHLKVLRYFKSKLPVYFRGDSTLLDERAGLKQLIRSIYLKWVYSHVDTAFYTGINNKAYFSKYGLKDHQLSFAPHAVDNRRFATDRFDEVINLRLGLNIKNNDILVLFAGKLEAKKSPLLLLDAFNKLNADQAHLLFIGNGELETMLKHRAKGNPRVHFIDFQNQTKMPAVYQSADVFCLPSGGPGESWGLAVNEAMACGRPVIVSDKCGCAPDLVDDSNGIIFKSGDVDKLVAALNYLTADKAKLQQCGQASAQKIAAWNFEQIAIAIENKLNSET